MNDFCSKESQIKKTFSTDYIGNLHESGFLSKCLYYQYFQSNFHKRRRNADANWLNDGTINDNSTIDSKIVKFW